MPDAPSPAVSDTAGSPARAPRRGGRAHRAAALAGAACLTVLLATGCSAAGGGNGTAHVNATASSSAASALAPAAPDRVTIPAIGVDAPLDAVGLDDRGVMREPDFAKPDDAAWYDQGPTPGEAGAAAIVGHMDTPRAPRAVFFRLKELTKDARIEVHREDGTTAVFAVDGIETFKKDAFPTDKVYGDTSGRPELRLITCGGTLTKDRHWDSDVVVFAHLTGKA
ncbi:class F sortase [Streptomyces erythrochromogenes]|uniref:class F sortase n=1 Tax=Streptomyces erythrochromogenes TaxID=285574 RepID=UPI0037015C3D